MRTPYTPAQNYAAFRAARRDRPGDLLNICIPLNPNRVGMWLSDRTFGPLVADSWRNGPDIGYPGNVSFRYHLRNLV